jgi:hypothetical protein
LQTAAETVNELNVSYEQLLNLLALCIVLEVKREEVFNGESKGVQIPDQ